MSRPRILVVNPYSTQSLTNLIKRSLEPLKEYAEIAVISVQNAPSANDFTISASIASAHAAATLIAARTEVLTAKTDGIVVACFSDHPLTSLLKELLPEPKVPIIGILEAACTTATLLGRRFAIVTVARRLELILWDAMRAHRFDKECAAIQSAEVNWEDDSTDTVIGSVLPIATDLVDSDGAEVIVLGSAALSGHAEALTNLIKPQVPIVDGLHAAIHIVLGLIRQKLFISGVGAFA